MSDNTPEMHHTKHDMAEHHMLVLRWLLEGYAVTVFDGEEYSLERSRDFVDIINEIEGVEEAEIFAHKHGIEEAKIFARKHGDCVACAWALITPYGVAHDETVADHSTEPWMCKMMAEIAASYYGE